MNKKEQSAMITLPDVEKLFDKIVSILEQARSNVVRVVNNNMVIAYWLIGKSLVEELQGGEERAEYGKKIIEEFGIENDDIVQVGDLGVGFNSNDLEILGDFNEFLSKKGLSVWCLRGNHDDKRYFMGKYLNYFSNFR